MRHRVAAPVRQLCGFAGAAFFYVQGAFSCRDQSVECRGGSRAARTAAQSERATLSFMTGATTPAPPALRRKLRWARACEAWNCASVTVAAAIGFLIVRALGMQEGLLGMSRGRAVRPRQAGAAVKQN